MAEPVMENPFSPPAPSPHQIYTKTITDITECVNELSKEYQESNYPISDDSQCLHRMCAKLEYLLRASMKPRTGLLGKKKDYWDFYCDCLSSNKSLNDGIKFVKSLSELKTSLGRGRAFIRFALVHQRLADTIQQCVCNTKITSEWYHPQAVWYQQRLVGDLISCLYDLNEIKFDLAPRGYDLDMNWPTYARPGYTGASGQSWNPRSRSTSISSLSSIPHLEIYPSSVSSADVDHIKFSQADDTDSAQDHLRQPTVEQLDKMENEKLAAEAVADDLKKKCEVLEKDLKEEQEQHKALQDKMQKTEAEHLSERQAWKTEEENLKKQLESTSESLTSLSGTMGRVEAAMGQSIESSELKAKVLTQEKQLMAVQMDLKATKMELETKTTLEEKKSRLIELLDKKLSQRETEYRLLDSKKQYLYDMAQGLIKDKEAYGQKLKDAAEQLQSLNARKQELEKLNKSLADNCKELQAMVNDLQSKGSQIARIALEKVKKYKEENDALQNQLDQKDQSNDKVAQLQQQLTEARSAVESQQSANATLCQSQLMELHSKLAATLENINKDSKSEELITAMQNLESLNQEMKNAMEILKNDEEIRVQKIAKEKEEMEARIRELTRDNKELLDHIAGASKFQEAASSTDEVKELKEKLSLSEAEVGKLTHELNGLKGAIASLIGGKEDAASQELLGVPDLLHALNARLDVPQQDAQPPEVSAKLSEVQAENHELNQLLEEKESLLRGLHETMACLEEKVQTYVSGEEELKATIDNFMTKIDRLKVQISDSRAENSKLRETLENFEEDTEMLKDSHRALVEEKAHTDTMNTQHVSRISALMAEKEQLSTELSAAKQEVESLSAALAETSEEKDRLQRELVKLEKDELSTTCEMIHSGDTLTEPLQQKSVEDFDRSRKVSHLQEALAEKGKTLENLTDKHASERDGFLQTIESFKTQIEELGKDREEMIKLNNEHQLEKDDLVRQNERLSETLRDSDVVKNKLEVDLETVKSEMHSKQVKLQELTFVERAFHDESKEKSHLEVRCSEMEKELAVIGEALNKAHMEIREGLVISETHGEDDVIQQIPDIKKLEDENVTLRDRLVDFLREKDQMFRNLVTEKSDLKDKIDSLQEDLSSTASEKISLGEKLHGFTEQNEKLVAQLADMTKELGVLQENMEASEKSLSEACMMRDEKEKEVGELTSDLDAMRQSLTQRQRVWENARESMETEISTLKFQLSSSQMEFDNKLQNYEAELVETTGLGEKLSQQSDLISHLEAQMQMTEQEQQSKHEQHEREVSRLRETIEGQETDLQKQNKTIHDLQNDIQEEHRSNILHQAEMVERKREFSERLDAYQHECNDLKLENTELKKKLIHLIKQKDALWQKTDKLEYDKKASASMVWMEDRDVKNCLGCNAEFSIRLRKHHCRKCGKIFCHSCAGNFVLTPHSSKKERVCNACFMDVETIMNQSMESTASTDSDRYSTRSLLEEVEDSIKIPTKVSPKWQKSVEGGGSDEEGEPLLSDIDTGQAYSNSPTDPPAADTAKAQLVEVEGNNGAEEEEESIYQKYSTHEEEEEPKSLTPPTESDPPPAAGTLSSVTRATIGVTKAMMGVAKAAVSKAASYTPGLTGTNASTVSAEDNVTESGQTEAGNLLTDDDKSKISSLAGARRDYDGSDETFDIVTHEEIATSSLDVLPDPNVISRLTITASEIADQGGMEIEPDLWISAGKIYAVPVIIEHANVMIHWEFSTTPKGIHFSVAYRAEEFSSVCEDLITTCKCNSHKQCVVGELDARKPGVYTLKFDNTQSRITSKKLSLRITVHQMS